MGRNKKCPVCAKHRPGTWRTCMLCGWKCGALCEPERCWFQEYQFCRWCMKEKMLPYYPGNAQDFILSFLWTAPISSKMDRRKKCRLCAKHRPGSWRTCMLCGWQCGDWCEPERCWFRENRICRWCMKEKMLPDYPRSAQDFILSFLWTAPTWWTE